MDAPLLLAGENTKSLILHILADEWPLSMKKIYFAVRKSSRKPMTYQAVYKSVKELLGQGVLAKQEEEYLISPLWIEKSSEFISCLAEAYNKRNIGSARRLQELNFNSLWEAWDFLLSRINTDFFGESKEAYVQLRRFFFFPISKEDIARLREFASRKKLIVMCRQKSLVDRLVAGFLTSLGATVVIGIECARPTNTLVYGDCVISTFVIGETERAGLSEYYNGSRDMKLPEAGLFKAFNSIFFRKMRVKLIINRDPGVLNDVLEQTRDILSKQPY